MDLTAKIPVAPAQYYGTKSAMMSLDQLNKRMKLKVSDFFKKLNPDTFHNYFDWFSLSEAKRASSSLVDQCGRIAPIGKRLKKDFESKYLLVNYEQLIYEDMLQWTQEPKAIFDPYTKRFHELSIHAKQ